MDSHYVYLIACKGAAETYVKIGLTSNIQRRLSNIQTGCPLPITNAFIVRSEHREEVVGLERLLHMLLRSVRLRAEWYEGTASFFDELDAVLSKINAGSFSHEELLEKPDFVGPEFEIMMHRHDFEFLRIQLPIKKGCDYIANAISMRPTDIAAALLRGGAG